MWYARIDTADKLESKPGLIEAYQRLGEIVVVNNGKKWARRGRKRGKIIALGSLHVKASHTMT